MLDTSYVEPTGLSSKNQSSARDLATLVNFAYGDPTLRELSTSTGYQVAVGNRTLQYNNTNRLVKNPAWDIGLQKTGYISEAGQCLVMQAKVAGRKLIMVFLDSAGKLSRMGDAERVKRWVESIAPADVHLLPHLWLLQNRQSLKRLSGPLRAGGPESQISAGRFPSVWAAIGLPCGLRGLKSTGRQPACFGRRKCLLPCSAHPIPILRCRWRGRTAVFWRVRAPEFPTA